MTVTVKYKTQSRRWYPNILFNTDIDDVNNLVVDYSGEIDTDTVSTVTVVTNDITAGTPSISNNVVTIALSGFREGSNTRLELTMTTTAGNVFATTVRFRAKDYYNG